MEDWPGGLYLVMPVTSRVPCGRQLMTIIYKYNSRKVLGFIATKCTGSNELDDPY